MYIGRKDKSKRTKRRCMVHGQRRPSQTNAESTTQHIEETEIKNHFDVCLKLFAQDKINVKNAWNLKIIDYMRSLLTMNNFGKRTLLMGGTSLDVGTKVYSIRVDDIHSEGLKLASSLACFENAEKTAPDIEDGEQNPVGRNEIPEKKKTQSRAPEKKNTVGKNMYTNISEVPKMESAIFQTRSTSDWSSVDNLFTCKLPANPSEPKVVFLSKKKSWQSSRHLDITLKMQKTLPFNMEIVPTKINLFKELEHFEINNWDLVKDDAEGLSTANCNQNELVFDDQGIPIVELDGTVHDIFNDSPLDDCLHEDDVKTIGMHKDIVNVCHLKPLANDPRSSNDYLYQPLDNDKYFSQMWAGPTHWKLKYLKRTTEKFSGAPLRKNVSKPRKKKLKVPDRPLDFEGVETLCKEFNNDKFSKCCNSSVKESQITLPRNLRIEAPLPLQMKRKVYVNKNVNKETFKTKVGHVQRFQNELCLVNASNDCDGNFYNQHKPIEENLDIQMSFIGSNLIDKPVLVPNTTINFVKRPKKMNMKKLKSAILKEVESDTNSGPKTFVGVYKNLPKHISRKMKEDLSSPLALAAILHLTTENNFSLEQTSLSNFSIKKL